MGHSEDNNSVHGSVMSSTAFIGVIDVIDSTKMRASKVKKNLVKTARSLRPSSLKKGALPSPSNAERSVASTSSQSEEDLHAGDESRTLSSKPPNPFAFGDDTTPYFDSDEEEHEPSPHVAPISRDEKKSREGRCSSMYTNANSIIESKELQLEEEMKREARRERVKEKLEKYKEDRKHLKFNCTVLEAQLIETAEKLREVDSKAAFKIDSLESELKNTREGMEVLVNKSTKEVTDQSMCIKTLGKKLIRQAHIIKQQKRAVEEYQIKLEALREEMAMQDERDLTRDNEYNELKEDFERTLQQKVEMQNSLEENVEEMSDLKHEKDMADARITELKLQFEEKEIDLERAKRENVSLSESMTVLETQLQDKTDEVEVLISKLKASDLSVDVLKGELERKTIEMEELRVKAEDIVNSRNEIKKDAAFKGWRRGSCSSTGDDESTLEEKLQLKDLRIQALDQVAKENEETINSLKSDIVKLTSTFKQEDYLKRKQIAKLKQENAEYALKLRALEKAFKGIHADSSLEMFRSRHSKSMHATLPIPSPSKQDMSNAVKARLGVTLAPYEFPSETERNSSDSDDGRRGEWPEEC